MFPPSLLRAGKLFCLAFSPVIDGARGSSTEKCGFQYTTITFFKPFSRDEVQKYLSKVQVSETLKKELNRYDNVIPGIILQCVAYGGMDHRLHTKVRELLLKLRYTLSSAPDSVKAEIMKVHDVLMRSALGGSLGIEDEAVSRSCGFFFFDGSSLKLVFLAGIVLQQLRSRVWRLVALLFDGLVFCKATI